MNTELLLAALGALLVLTGVLGGGFEIREIKIPRIGWGGRAAASIVGVFCILLAIGLSTTGSTMAKDNAPRAVSTATPAPEVARFRLHDELGDGQVTEQVTIVFDGRQVGDIKVNEDFPTGTLEVTVPHAGAYDYTLASETEELLDDGTLGVIDGAGQGRITVTDGGDYDVQMADSGSTRALTLVAE
jgi:hypothetical protein